METMKNFFQYLVTFLKGLGIAILSVFAMWGFVEVTVWFGNMFLALTKVNISPEPILAISILDFLIGLVGYIALLLLGWIIVGIYKLGTKI